MEDLLVDREQWVIVEPRTKPIGTSNEDWMKLNGKDRSTIQLCLVELVLLNVLEEDTMKKLWDKLGSLYQSKSMGNNLFLQNKLYLLRMNCYDSVIEHLNAFNIVISHLLFVDIKITEGENCISLMCSLPDSWDNLVMAICSNVGRDIVSPQLCRSTFLVGYCRLTA